MVFLMFVSHTCFMFILGMATATELHDRKRRG